MGCIRVFGFAALGSAFRFWGLGLLVSFRAKVRGLGFRV